MDENGRLVMTVEAYKTKYTAEIEDSATLDRVMGRVVVPLLKALGYNEESIGKLFVDGNPEYWDTAYEG